MDCRDCRHSEPSALGMGQLNCLANVVPVPTNWARRSEGDCGPGGNLFSLRDFRPEPLKENER